MALTPVPTIDPALPVPPNPADEEAVFDAKAYAWSEALPGFGSDVKAIGDATYANAQWAGMKAAEAAEQVPLAADQVSIAEGHASNAATSADSAAESAISANTSAVNALASEVAASKLNLGAKSSPPALDNQGDALLAGATYYDTALDKWRVYSGADWADGISAVAGVSSVNGKSGAVTIPLMPYFVLTNMGVI